MRNIFEISASKSTSLNFLIIFRQLFQKQNFSIFRLFENFGLFLPISEIQPNTFSCRFRPLEDTFGPISLITPIIFPESPVEIPQFLGFLKKNWIANRLFTKYFPQTLNALYFWNHCVETYIPNFWKFFDNFFKSKIFQNRAFMKISPSFNHFQNSTNTFSHRFLPPGFPFGSFSWITPTIFSE